MIGVKVIGVKDILKNLRVSRKKAGKGVEVGLKAAGKHLMRESQRIVPVQHGILKESAYTRARGSRMYTEVFVGYTAEYALYVHENLAAAHGAEYNKKYGSEEGGDLRGANQQAKFLEMPARVERRKMLQIIRHRVKAFMI